jgi:hypothetical protein
MQSNDFIATRRCLNLVLPSSIPITSSAVPVGSLILSSAVPSLHFLAAVEEPADGYGTECSKRPRGGAERQLGVVSAAARSRSSSSRCLIGFRHMFPTRTEPSSLISSPFPQMCNRIPIQSSNPNLARKGGGATTMMDS